MLERNHDYNDLLRKATYFDSVIINFYLNPDSVKNANEIEHSTRKRYTEKTKREMREHYLLTQNFVASAKAFNVNESTLRNIVKTLPRNVKPIDKGNRSGAGRPLTYPLEVENDLVCWILKLRDMHFPVSVLALQEKGRSVICPHNPTFNASRGWVQKFFARHRLSLRSRTSVSQKLPQQLESSITKFYLDAGRYMRIGKYPLSLVGNMDETPAFFDMVPAKSITKTGTKECVVRTSGGEKKHVTVVLSAAADGTMLPPMVIFKGKTERTIEKLRIPEGFVVKCQEKAWMDEHLMKVWLDDIWLEYIKKVSKDIGFENSLLTYDAFAAHKTDDIQSKLVENKCDALMIPAGCTSKCQPMDVCINKPFKAILRKCWVEHVSKVIEKMPEPSSKPDFKLPPPSKQDIVDWVEKAHKVLSNDKEMVARSFEVCGITTTDPSKVRSGEFYEQCMGNAKTILDLEDDATEKDDDDDDPFEL